MWTINMTTKEPIDTKALIFVMLGAVFVFTVGFASVYYAH
jgi:hypothetical protein